MEPVTVSFRNTHSNRRGKRSFSRRCVSSRRRQGRGGGFDTSLILDEILGPPKPFSWKLYWKAKYDEVSHSLFYAPSVAVLAGIVIAGLLTFLDTQLSANEEFSLPIVLTTTVDSARAVLGTVASATISFAGIAFSVSLLVIQLGASQLSPRVVQTLFQDQFNKNVMALVVGTFTYCLVVLRSVRHELEVQEEDGEPIPPVVPNLSVSLAVILGILSILATVAFIDKAAKTMDVSQLLERVTRDTITQIRHVWVEVANMTTVQVEIGQDGMIQSTDVLPEFNDNPTVKEEPQEEQQEEEVETDLEESSSSDEEFHIAAARRQERLQRIHDPLSRGPSMGNSRDDTEDDPYENHHVVRFIRSGWVQEIDLQSILPLVPPHGKIQLHTIEGRYAIPGVAICTISWNMVDIRKFLMEKQGGFMTNEEKEKNSSRDNANEDKNNDSDEDEEEEWVATWLDTLEDKIRSYLLIGVSRSMRLDPSYGLRELVDVSLRALSPGINDPTTAQDGIFHTAAVVIEFLKRNPPPHQYVTSHTTNGGSGLLVLAEQQDHDGIVRLAYDEVRKCAASSPTVCVYLLESLRLIRESLRAEGLDNRAPEIERQVRLIEEGCLLTKQAEDDYLFITRARRDRFSDEQLESQNAYSHRRIPRKDDMNLDQHMMSTHQAGSFY